MRKLAKIFLPTIAMLMLGLCAASTAAAQMSKDKAMDETQTVSGCLQKGDEPGGFMIIGENNKHWELYGDKDMLAGHVGHQVTITGTVAHRTAKQEAKSQPHEKKEMGKRDHADLKVSDVKMVSETCSH